MKKIIWTGIGLLLAAMSANAAELMLDARSGLNSSGAGLVLGFSGIDLAYPRTVVTASAVDTGFEAAGNSESDFDYAGSSLVGWSEYPVGFRLTAGVIESDPEVNLDTGFQGGIGSDAATPKSVDIVAKAGPAESAENSVTASNAQPGVGPGVGRDTGFKLAVGLGTTTLEPDISRDAEPSGGGLDGVNQGELAALLNEAGTESTIDLANFFARPALAIGVNFVF